MARELKKKVAISSKPVVTPATLSTAFPSPMAKLKQLKDTLDVGLITQDEYDKNSYLVQDIILVSEHLLRESHKLFL